MYIFLITIFILLKTIVTDYNSNARHFSYGQISAELSIQAEKERER